MICHLGFLWSPFISVTKAQAVSQLSPFQQKMSCRYQGHNLRLKGLDQQQVSVCMAGKWWRLFLPPRKCKGKTRELEKHNLVHSKVGCFAEVWFFICSFSAAPSPSGQPVPGLWHPAVLPEGRGSLRAPIFALCLLDACVVLMPHQEWCQKGKGGKICSTCSYRLESDCTFEEQFEKWLVFPTVYLDGNLLTICFALLWVDFFFQAISFCYYRMWFSLMSAFSPHVPFILPLSPLLWVWRAHRQHQLWGTTSPGGQCDPRHRPGNLVQTPGLLSGLLLARAGSPGMELHRGTCCLWYPQLLLQNPRALCRQPGGCNDHVEYEIQSFYLKKNCWKYHYTGLLILSATSPLGHFILHLFTIKRLVAIREENQNIEPGKLFYIYICTYPSIAFSPIEISTWMVYDLSAVL